jgi:uncharacterized alkaline shock family protein YloU
MPLERNSKHGNINITMDAIASIAGNAATECYGVVGMASKSSIFNGIAELLKKENYNKGVFVKETKDGIEIEIYIIVAFGVRVTEIVSEVQKKVKYVLEKTLDLKFKAVNVYVQDIKKL